MVARLTNSQFSIIRKQYLSGPFVQRRLASELRLSRTTVRKYVVECRDIERLFPERLNDFNFRLPRPTKKPRVRTKMYQQLIESLPGLIDEYTEKKLMLIPLWNSYHAKYPEGYGLCWFSIHYIAWRREKNICQFVHRRVKNIPDDDRVVLNKWKNSFDHKKWERAVVILDSNRGRRVFDMMEQMDRSLKTILRWIDAYKQDGIPGLIDEPRKDDPLRQKEMKIKQDNLVKLIHETPLLHGINRTSWRIEDLVLVYKRIYKVPIERSCVGTNLKKMGYGFRKSRQVMTSPDPHFREKLDNIKNILSHLAPTERFFSVDEFGHFAVKIRGGRSIVKNGELKTTPQLQKSKGFLIMTAALELSSNQVTHFYSREKNTAEMIKLIDVLLLQYRGCSKLYISWDAAAWHTSKILKERIKVVNGDEYRTLNAGPLIELAPLPSSAQFLNVIESVFGGLARAVLHNSDYPSVEDCKSAIDRHFVERNQHYQTNPKRAGSKIWGKETVAPVFNEINNCKSFRRLNKPL